MEQPVAETKAVEERPKLNSLNWLNVAAYISNIAITYGVGVLGWFGNGTNDELSEKYQTIVTPKSTAFAIWALIFTLQAVFIILQMFPRFRGKAMVQQGVGYWYLPVCFFQIAWTVAFAYEIIWVSLLFIILVWLGLVGLVYSQYYTPSEGTLVEFWLLRFPFALHCGWLTAASVLNVNLLLVDLSFDTDSQLAVGIISLAYLHAAAVWVLFGFARPNYTIAGVLAWAFWWIYSELQDPKDLILETFNEDIIVGVANAARGVTFIVVAQIFVRTAYNLYQVFMTKRNEKSEDEEKV